MQEPEIGGAGMSLVAGSNSPDCDTASLLLARSIVVISMDMLGRDRSYYSGQGRSAVVDRVKAVVVDGVEAATETRSKCCGERGPIRCSGR